MSKRIPIGFDIDDTLAQFMTGLIDFYNHRFGTNFKRNDFRQFGLEKTWGGSKERAMEIVYDFYHSLKFKEIIPMTGSTLAMEALQLKRRYDFFATTSRPTEITAETNLWINKYFPNVFKEVILTNSYSRDNSPSKTKAEICNEIGIEVFVDDCLESAIECCGKDRIVLLPNAPWNQGKNVDKGMRRVQNWAGIVALILFNFN